jgi:TetR/AcrR family transcriptional regulator, repressor for uid operon
MDPAPEQATRAEVRRRQVLDAAIRCFRRQGFHATSMAVIAAEAGMSVGHIYRYFAGKDEIIQAIVHEDTEEALASMAKLETSGEDVYRALIEGISETEVPALDHDRAALILEVRAEAARNPSVASVVEAADRELRSNFARILAQAKPDGWSEADLTARIELMALLFDGIPTRIVSHPDLDRAALFDMIRRTIAGLLETW